jgi:hypothetical protein
MIKNLKKNILNIYEEQKLNQQATMRKIGISDFSTKHNEHSLETYGGDNEI